MAKPKKPGFPRGTHLLPVDWEAIAVMRELRRRRLLPAIAAGCGIKLNSVYRWTAVPLRHVVEVERVTGVPREKLRPDYHRAVAPPPPPQQADAPPLLAAE